MNSFQRVQLGCTLAEAFLESGGARFALLNRRAR